MKKISIEWLVLVAVYFIFSASSVYAGGAVVITEPATGTTVSSPVRVCMAVDGVAVNQLKRELTLVRVTTTSSLMLTFLTI